MMRLASNDFVVSLRTVFEQDVADEIPLREEDLDRRRCRARAARPPSRPGTVSLASKRTSPVSRSTTSARKTALSSAAKSTLTEALVVLRQRVGHLLVELDAGEDGADRRGGRGSSGGPSASSCSSTRRSNVQRRRRRRSRRGLDRRVELAKDRLVRGRGRGRAGRPSRGTCACGRCGRRGCPSGRTRTPPRSRGTG